MKSFSERSPLLIGAVGTAVIVGVVLAGLQYQRLPFVNQRNSFSAYFADAGGLQTNAVVEVSGLPGRKSIEHRTGRTRRTGHVQN
ncbi:MCE-family Mce3C domain protein [Mycobacterium intracellulare]|nr:MCE-family Mce3C domain protein [Mycobacterium intracellulare]